MNLTELNKRRHRVAKVRLKKLRLSLREKGTGLSEESVYLIQHGNSVAFKIGHGSPKKRISTLQVGNPVPLSIVKCIEVENKVEAEKMLHNKYKALKISGEWFLFSKKILEVVKNDFDRIEVGLDVTNEKVTEIIDLETIKRIACGQVPSI